MTYLELCQKFATRSGVIGTAPSAVTGQSGRQAKCVDWIAHAWELIQQLHQSDWKFLHGEWSGSLADGDDTYAASDLNIASRFGEWKIDRPNDRGGLYRPTTLYDPDIGVSDEGELIFIPYDAWRERYDRGSQTEGRPVHYTIAPDQTLRFGPTPDQIYTVSGEYLKAPQTLAANGDEPDMPDQYHSIIINRAIILASEHDESVNGLAAAIRGYDEALMLMRNRLLPDISTPLGA